MVINAFTGHRDIVMVITTVGSYSLVPLLQLPYGLGRGKGRAPCIPRKTTPPSCTASWQNARLTRKPAAPMCWRKHCPPGDRVSVHVPSHNLDDARPVVRLLVPDGCDTARYQTRICSSGASPAMQCLRASQVEQRSITETFWGHRDADHHHICLEEGKTFNWSFPDNKWNKQVYLSGNKLPER